MSAPKEALEAYLPRDRHEKHGSGCRRCDGSIYEFGRCPDLIKSIELLRPILRIFTQFPHWINHVVRIRWQVASQMRQSRLDLVTINVEYIQIESTLTHLG